MSKKLSEETIEKLFNESEWNDLYHIDANEVVTKTAKKVFTTLMPIIEKQNEALGELVHHCRDYALAEESFVIAMAVDKANDTIQETKQMIEKQLEEVSDHKER